MFFKDEESPCGSVKTGFITILGVIKFQTWDCGCRVQIYPDGEYTKWCGCHIGNNYRSLPGVFTSNEEVNISARRNGKPLYQRM